MPFLIRRISLYDWAEDRYRTTSVAGIVMPFTSGIWPRRSSPKRRISLSGVRE
jgi:hypothetical protein